MTHLEQNQNQAVVGLHMIPPVHFHPIPKLNNLASGSYSAAHVQKWVGAKGKLILYITPQSER